MTFGSKEEQSQICTLTKIGLILHDGQKRPLKLYCVPFICHPLTCQPISFCRENFEHLNSLELEHADPSDNSSHLDVDIPLDLTSIGSWSPEKFVVGVMGPLQSTLSWDGSCLDLSVLLHILDNTHTSCRWSTSKLSTPR